MAINQLTAKEIEHAKLAPGETEKVLRDGEGLELRIRPGGSYWMFRYSWEGKRVVIAIVQNETGSTKEAHKRRAASTELARSTAAAYRAWLKPARGANQAPRDPRAVLAEMAAADASSKAQAAALAELERARLEQAAARATVRRLFERWTAPGVMQRSDATLAEMKRSFEKDVFPAIGDRYADQVTKGDCMAIIDGVLARGANRLAKRIFSDLRQMFDYAVSRDIIGVSPIAAIKKKDVGTKDETRERYLNEAELRDLFAKLPDSGLLKATRYGVLLMLATMARVGELTRAQWSHVDLEAGTWLIPAENSKNGKPHTIYLSAFAVEQYKALKAVCTSETWVYPNREDTGHIDLKSISKQLHDRQRTAPLKNRSKAVGSLILSRGEWTPHDLRRTGATLMQGLGVLPGVIERCLNHTDDNRMAAIYQRHDYAPEMRDAWRLLGDRLSLLQSRPANVRVLAA
ncbi:tyrosine-type recombinase/integrase [Caballeronia sp. LZ033]|uniref:tyrosine-type recombinase/integrase n=1 Tax=Caballeronia sp. LZ033 TaxID=3038566 RepID=UPI002866ACCA|nr:tyrosine-type recombinase/integrase [Caballeronia sp. LZ033]MDR5813049.1 tyrosine-type recombinase/integrase [Caballeronia sp. LZ033]